MKKHLHQFHIVVLLLALTLISIFVISNIIVDKTLQSYPTSFGVSFAPRYAKDLGLDSRKIYQDILTQGVKNVRLSAYWDEIEEVEGKYNFQDLDWYIEQATQQSAQIILAIGYKLPRWPECRAPQWLDSQNYQLLREKELLMLDAVINHYNNHPQIVAFQLENEPLLMFGVCPNPDRKFLKKEVEFVQSRTQKPIIITDSGELRPWKTPMEQSDIFGTTLYRVVDTAWFGAYYYPLKPWYYRTKSDLIRKFFAKNNQRTIISELQAESWANKPLTEIPIEEQIDRFSLEQFKQTVDFTRKTGFTEAYLWGVEWWYYLTQNGHPEYLEYVKSLF